MSFDRLFESIDRYESQIKQLTKERDEYKECKQKWFDEYNQYKGIIDEIKSVIDTNLINVESTIKQILSKVEEQ